MADNEGMKDLIQLVNLLQDAASKGDMNLGQLDLPQIAVIGEQSSGKSSVLENFVGRDFLPRGSGIVTRRPLILQLHYNENEEYGEFLHLPEKKFADFLEIRKEIQAETDRTTAGKGISNVPINLRIYSPNVLDLTVVDLPGITQVPVGDQPADIAKRILDMIQEYISSENTLILAVSPANQDLANSNALKLAKSVDPEGLRTFGVVTKLDLMDKGTDAREILENKILPLRRGYIGLVNRSQADIDKSKDIQVAQQAEMNFFKKHDAYRHMANRMGTKYLQQILNEQLCEHIRDKMPIIRASLKKQYEEVSRELESIQAFTEEKTDSWTQTTIIKIMQEFSNTFRVFLSGHSTNVDGTQLNAGARINHCVYGQIYTLLNQMVAPSEKEVKILIMNEHGKRNALFVSELVIDVVVDQLLTHYSEPMNRCVELAADIISSAITELSKQFTAYPRLKDAVQSLLAEKLKSNEETTKKHLQIHLKAQAAFMNTRHPEFQKIADRSDIPADFNARTSFNENGLTRSDSNSSLSSTTSAPSDGFEKVSRRDTTKLEILQTGWITVFPNGIAKPSKRFWFKLHNDALTWYATDSVRTPFAKKEKDPIGSVLLEDLQVIINSKSGENILEKSGRSPSHQLQSMVFAFATQAEEDEWQEAFLKAGLQKPSSPKPHNDDWVDSSMENLVSSKLQPQKEQNATDLQGRRQLYEKVDKDIEIQESYEKIIYMVYSYMKIVDKTIHDLVPKYIYLLLIDETTAYTTKDLLADLLQDENWRDFLEVSQRELARRERLYSLYKSTKDALDVLSSVDIPTG